MSEFSTNLYHSLTLIGVGQICCGQTLGPELVQKRSDIEGFGPITRIKLLNFGGSSLILEIETLRGKKPIVVLNPTIVLGKEL